MEFATDLYSSELKAKLSRNFRLDWQRPRRQGEFSLVTLSAMSKGFFIYDYANSSN